MHDATLELNSVWKHWVITLDKLHFVHHKWGTILSGTIWNSWEVITGNFIFRGRQCSPLPKLLSFNDWQAEWEWLCLWLFAQWKTLAAAQTKVPMITLQSEVPKTRCQIVLHVYFVSVEMSAHNSRGPIFDSVILLHKSSNGVKGTLTRDTADTANPSSLAVASLRLWSEPPARIRTGPRINSYSIGHQFKVTQSDSVGCSGRPRG